ncbi:MAG: glutathione synthase [Anaerolineae bacterium]|nr:glutathione synthase [Anaerolineae bacterium]
MRIGFVVNDVMTETPTYTTTRLGLAALQLGHEAWVMGVGDFIYNPDGTIGAWARSAPGKKYQSTKTYLAAVQDDEAKVERITVDDLDVLMLRNDPADDIEQRSWAQTSGILFGQLAVRRGVIVLNDPYHLANAINKTYFQHFPDEVRPKTLISRNAQEIKRFILEELGSDAVLKPLQGSGGQSVFLVRNDDAVNVNQMIEAVLRDGYVIVQEYLPAAAKGDIRLFVMNGHPLKHNGKYAAFRRVNKSGDMRSNMHTGGKAEAAKLDDKVWALVDMVRPKLIEDGMFLVGLDIVGDKLMEINVFSPGGLGSAQQLTDVDFSPVVIEALERKVRYQQYYRRNLDNVKIATLY